jgi:hypothetical protein
MTPTTESALQEAAKAIADNECDNVMDEDRSNCIASETCHCADNARAAVLAFLRKMDVSPEMVAAWFGGRVIAELET